MTGVSILQNVSATIRLAVEVAWGADLTDLTAASWAWSDITADVLMGNGNGVELQMGRPDESSTTQTAVCTIILDNRSGAYSQGGQASNYPNVVRGTPVRVRVSTNSGSTWTVQFQGNAVGFTPVWDTTGIWATVTLAASGPLRRLSQGNLVSASPLLLGLAGDSRLIAYWPCEEAPTASSAAALVSTTTGVGPIRFSATGGIVSSQGTFGTYSSAWTSKPVMTVPKGAVPTTAFTSGITLSGQFQASMLLGKTTDAANTIATNDTNLLLLNGFTGTLGGIGIFYGPSKNGISIGTLVQNITGFDTDSHDTLLVLQLTQSGSDINYRLQFLALDTGSSPAYNGTISGKTIGNLASNFQVAFNDFPNNGAAGGFSFGHVAIWNQNGASNIATDPLGIAFLGNLGESPDARISRLANASNVPVVVLTDSATETSASPADTMGPQNVDALTNNLREAEATGFGVLYDGLNNGLTYVTRLLRESQQPLLTLNASSGVVVMPFAPVDDDQAAINSVTVQERNGATATYTKTTGALSSNQVGLYQTSLTVNQAYTPQDLTSAAQWLVHLGTVDGYRYPTFSFDLEKSPSLIPSWLSCFPSCRIDISNISAVRTQHPVGTLRNVLEGWRERITQHQWHVDANCTSYEPWRVVTLAAPTGTTVDTVGRYESNGSTLASSASLGATSLSVATSSGPLWTQSSVTADDFPLTISLGGLPVTVSAISGSSSPQTFTVSALTKAAPSGSAVTIWQNAVLAM
jgi:hypothetical protein